MRKTRVIENELRRRHEEKRTGKNSLWSNWWLKVILFLAILALYGRSSSNRLDFFKKMLPSNRIDKRIEYIENK
jgi:hypothetical protein